ncbi:hypothetical protein [Capnocytophaga sp.]|uniref:hypothetical protein n=1 Tax=Capnocytophaga sp. TaxID=44737 RepID=UPI0026DDB301|nr:hypothetical protein [Capnocytophaga sp.]MDO5106590.1 hypothetical protein [Capnocytophaga sp.]
MDRLIFNQTGGFPLTTDILNALQNAYAVFNSISGLSGNLAILSGCEARGNNISDGFVVIGNEVFPFKGGTALADSRVVVKEEIETKLFEDGTSKGVIVKKIATFGNGTTTYNWADFKRIKNLQDINNQSFESENSLLKRLEKLERRVTKTVPIGLVAIWDRPAYEIPEGWVEHTEMQGFTPVGQKAGDTDFGRLGKTLGSKTHRLTTSELPRTELDIINKNGSGFEVMGNGHRSIDSWHRGGGQWAGGHNLPQWGKERGSQLKASLAGQDSPHNNIQPSRIVRFIRFVGFND